MASAISRASLLKTRPSLFLRGSYGAERLEHVRRVQGMDVRQNPAS